MPIGSLASSTWISTSEAVNIHSNSNNNTSQGVHPVENALQHKHFVKEATRWGVAEHDVSFTGKFT